MLDRSLQRSVIRDCILSRQLLKRCRPFSSISTICLEVPTSGTANASQNSFANSMFLEFLGTSSAKSTKTRNVSSIALHLPAGGALLFDCGEGTTRQMNYSKVNPRDLKAVFITHLHGDHIYGLPGLGMSFLDLPNKNIPLFAPTGLEALMGTFLRNFDLHSISKPNPPNRTKFTPCSTTRAKKLVSPTVIDEKKMIHYDIEKDRYCVYNDFATVEAKPISHTVFCLGYVIKESVSKPKFNREKMEKAGLVAGKHMRQLQEEKILKLENGNVIHLEEVTDPPRKPRKVVILGDTSDPSNIIDLAKDADILVHEATCSNMEITNALAYGHSTAGMAGAFAKKINAKTLILTHFSPRNFNGSEISEAHHIRLLVNEAKQTFGNSNVYPADDFFKFAIPQS